MAAGGPHVSIAPETLWQWQGLPITNSLLTSWIVMGMLCIFAVAATAKLKKRPSRGQVVVELIVGGLYDFFKDIVGEKYIKETFPLIGSIFFYVIVSNWLGLIPGVGSIGFFRGERQDFSIVQKVSAETVSQVPSLEKTLSSEPENSKGEAHATSFVPLLRAPTADLNFTLALALVVVIHLQYFGIKHTGLAYLSKFFNVKNPILFVVGILEIIGELSRILSYSFRLFGNIFAGEVLLAIMTFLIPFIIPAPFYGLEVFVGFIQAFVFAMLAGVFMKLAVAHGEHANEGNH